MSEIISDIKGTFAVIGFLIVAPYQLWLGISSGMIDTAGKGINYVYFFENPIWFIVSFFVYLVLLLFTLSLFFIAIKNKLKTFKNKKNIAQSKLNRVINQKRRTKNDKLRKQRLKAKADK